MLWAGAVCLTCARFRWAGLKVTPPAPLPKGTCTDVKEGTDYNGGDITSIVTESMARPRHPR